MRSASVIQMRRWMTKIRASESLRHRGADEHRRMYTHPRRPIFDTLLNRLLVKIIG